jgi:hypothetical protein
MVFNATFNNISVISWRNFIGKAIVMVEKIHKNVKYIVIHIFRLLSQSNHLQEWLNDCCLTSEVGEQFFNYIMVITSQWNNDNERKSMK